MYCQYLDHLPKLPEHLVQQCLDKVKSMNKPFYSYERHECPYEVVTFVRQFFDHNYNISMHTIDTGTGMHVDRRRIAYNYILDTGGIDVHTYFFGNERGWNPNNPPVSEKYIIEPFRWHRLEVDVNHAVFDVTTLRIALSVTHIDDALNIAHN